MTEDQEWIDFFAAKSIVVSNEMTEDFTARVKDDMLAHVKIMLDSELVTAEYVTAVEEACK